jgi:hypothetical protein
MMIMATMIMSMLTTMTNNNDIHIKLEQLQTRKGTKHGIPQTSAKSTLKATVHDYHEMRTSFEIRTPYLIPKCCSQCKLSSEMWTPLI